MQDHRRNQPSQAREVRPYQAPAVQDLGPWKSLTLIYSLPIGPGTRGNAAGENNVF